MSASTPALVGISHGTSSEDGRLAVRGLRDAVIEAVERRHPDAPPAVRLGHVDVEQPDVPATLASLEPGSPAVVVPLLLSAGYHVHVDLTEAVDAATDRPVALSGALGPDDRLATVLLRRLVEAGLRDDDRVVLAVAGSSDQRAVADSRVVLANYLLAPGYFDDLARAAGADVVARPLLVPDEPAPSELVEIVLDRYAAASAQLG